MMINIVDVDVEKIKCELNFIFFVIIIKQANKPIKKVDIFYNNNKQTNE